MPVPMSSSLLFCRAINVYFSKAVREYAFWMSVFIPFHTIEPINMPLRVSVCVCACERMCVCVRVFVWVIFHFDFLLPLWCAVYLKAILYKTIARFYCAIVSRALHWIERFHKIHCSNTLLLNVSGCSASNIYLFLIWIQEAKTTKKKKKKRKKKTVFCVRLLNIENRRNKNGKEKCYETTGGACN